MDNRKKFEPTPLGPFPTEIWYEIFQHLDKAKLRELAVLNSQFHKISNIFFSKNDWPLIDRTKPAHTYNGHFYYRPQVFPLPDGSVALGLSNGLIYLSELRQKGFITLDSPHKKGIRNIIQLESNGDLVSSSNDYKICFWDRKTLKAKVIFNTPYPVQKILPFEKYVLVVYLNGQIELKDPNDLNKTAVLSGFDKKKPENYLSFVKTMGKQIVCEQHEFINGNYSHKIKIWNEKLQLIREIDLGNIKGELITSLQNKQTNQLLSFELKLKWGYLPDNFVTLIMSDQNKNHYFFILDLSNNKEPVFISTTSIITKNVNNKLFVLIPERNKISVLTDWNSALNQFQTRLSHSSDVLKSRYIAKILHDGSVIYGCPLYKKNGWKIWDIATNQHTTLSFEMYSNVVKESLSLNCLIASARINELIFHTPEGLVIWDNPTGKFQQKIALPHRPQSLYTLNNGDLVSYFDQKDEPATTINLHQFSIFNPPGKRKREEEMELNEEKSSLHEERENKRQRRK